jgi:hypothetical protein
VQHGRDLGMVRFQLLALRHVELFPRALLSPGGPVEAALPTRSTSDG